MSSTTPYVGPGYPAGTWQIDPDASHVEFSMRMLFGRVRGRFTDVDATIRTAASLTGSSVSAAIDLASIDTGNTRRDEHLRGPDILNTGHHADIVNYHSTAVQLSGRHVLIDGELTIRNVTAQVPLVLELDKSEADQAGGTTATFVASAQVSRRAFGIRIPMECAGLLIGDKVTIQVRLHATLCQEPR